MKKTASSRKVRERLIKRNRDAVAAAAGRLVAITATGPIYKRHAAIVVVPISVGLALTQELALRALDPMD